MTQVVMWINQNFLLQDDLVVDGTQLDLAFMSLRRSGPLTIHMEQGGQVGICAANFIYTNGTGWTGWNWCS